jgi:4-carboxymuconolactone decarboxylase
MTSKDFKNTDQFKKGLEVAASKSGVTPQWEEDYEFCPALADVIVSHGLGDLWGTKTPNLTMQMKEIAVLSSLITSCTVQSEIKSHTKCLLNLGITKEQIKEVLILLTLYIGVPKIVVARNLIKEAFKEYDAMNVEKTP